MKTKVCFVSLRSYAVFKPDMGRSIGGAEVQVYLLSRELAKDPDFEVVLISRDYGQQDGEIIDGVRHHKIFQGTGLLRRFGVLRNAMSAWSLFRKLGSIDADVHIQRCAGVETGIVSLFCRIKRKPWLFAAASDTDLDGGFEGRNPGWISSVFRRGVESADVVVCQNDYQRENLARRFVKKGRVMLSLCEVPETYASPAGHNILWVSRCVPNKGPERFVELARAFPDAEFVMIMNKGPDPDYNAAVFDMAGTVENLRVVDHVPYQEIEAYYRNARVIVSTATFEGFPNTFLQAMKYGVPVLSLSVNPNEIITREGVGFFAGGDCARLEEGLTQIMADEKAYREMSRNSYHYVASHHDIQQLTAEYKTLIRFAPV